MLLTPNIRVQIQWHVNNYIINILIQKMSLWHH